MNAAGRAPVKLLIADVDGTLVTGAKALTDGTCRAVDRLRAAGIELAITSGRPPRGMAMLVEPLKLTTPIAAFNGGLFVKPDLTTVLEQRTLPLAVARETLDFLLHAGLDVWVYRDADWFIRAREAPHVAHEQSTVQFEPTVIGDLSAVLEGAVKIVGRQRRPRPGGADRGRAAPAGCGSRLGGALAAVLSRRHPPRRQQGDGGPLRRPGSCTMPLGQIATIGDMPNDVLMFAVGGVSIAMGNASPDVQRCARYVTTSNEDEGFAHAVDSFVLGLHQL